MRPHLSGRDVVGVVANEAEDEDSVRLQIIVGELLEQLGVYWPVRYRQVVLQ